MVKKRMAYNLSTLTKNLLESQRTKATQRGAVKHLIAGFKKRKDKPTSDKS